MSAGFKFRGEICWGSNGSIEVYLEALQHQATIRFGASDLLTEFFRSQREGSFMGMVVFLDDVLTDAETCDRFLSVLDAATDRLLSEEVFTELGRNWISSTLGPFRQRISDVAGEK